MYDITLLTESRYAILFSMLFALTSVFKFTNPERQTQLSLRLM
jgi:hypothetical protein